jgi:hypothetical protein
MKANSPERRISMTRGELLDYLTKEAIKLWEHQKNYM